MIEVHEHRAPTDDSVKILMELENAAKKKIETSISVGDNGFQCVTHLYHDNLSDSIIAKAIFDLNGKKLTEKARAYRYEAKDKRAQIQLLYTRLKDSIAQRLAIEIITEAFNKALKEAW